MGPCVLTVFCHCGPTAPSPHLYPATRTQNGSLFWPTRECTGAPRVRDFGTKGWKIGGGKILHLPARSTMPQPRRPCFPPILTAAATGTPRTGQQHGLTVSHRKQQKVVPNWVFTRCAFPTGPAALSAALGETVTWCGSPIHFVHRVHVGLICPFPTTIARAHAPPSLHHPPVRQGGSLHISIFLFFFSSSQAPVAVSPSPPGPTIPPSTGELGASTDPTAHEYITSAAVTHNFPLLLLLPIIHRPFFPPFWNLSVFRGFLFRPVLLSRYLTAVRGCFDTNRREISP